MRKIFKKVFSVALFVIILSVSAFAESFVYEFEDIHAKISFPMGYSVITLENIENHTDTLEKLGFKKDLYKKMMEDELAYAVGYSEDLSKEIWFNVYTDENAESIFDMDNFTDEDMEIYKNSVTADTTYHFEEAEFAVGKTGRYFKTVREFEGKRSLTYITIKNGAYYSVHISQKNEGEITDQSRSDVESVFNCLEFTEKLTDPNDRFSFKNILTVICMGALCVVSFSIVIVVLKKMGYLKTDRSKKLKTKTKNKRPILK